MHRLRRIESLTGSDLSNPTDLAEVVAAESKAIWERNLLTLSEGSLPERVGAAEELGRSGRPEAFNRLLPLVRDSQVVLAAAALFIITVFGTGRASLDGVLTRD